MKNNGVFSTISILQDLFVVDTISRREISGFFPPLWNKMGVSVKFISSQNLVLWTVGAWIKQVNVKRSMATFSELKTISSERNATFLRLFSVPPFLQVFEMRKKRIPTTLGIETIWFHGFVACKFPESEWSPAFTTSVGTTGKVMKDFLVCLFAYLPGPGSTANSYPYHISDKLHFTWGCPGRLNW